MDAREYFEGVVVPSYNQFKRQGDFYSLKNAIVSMDGTSEHLALRQLGYAQVSRKMLAQETRKIRSQSSSLIDLHSCSNTLKHGRSIRDYRSGKFETTGTSTSIYINDPTTWRGPRNLDLVEVLHSGFATLNSLLNAPST
jgi:hypothetical protein